MTNTRRTSSRRLAIHESGHAVAAISQRRRFGYVTIVPDADKGYLGVCTFAPAGAWFQPETAAQDDRRTRVWIERDVICCLAGAAAVKTLTGRTDWHLSGFDRRNAVNLLAYLTGTQDELDAYYRWLWIRTTQLLAQPWHKVAVEALTEQLLASPTICYRRARDVVANAIMSVVERRE